jgi:hypothetical protein
MIVFDDVELRIPISYVNGARRGPSSALSFVGLPPRYRVN